MLSVLLVWLLNTFFPLFHSTWDSPEQRKMTGSPVLTTRAGRSGLITGDAEPAEESRDAKMMLKDVLLEFTLLSTE